MWPFERKVQNTVRARDKPQKPKASVRGNYKSVRRMHADRMLGGYEAIYAAVSRIANTVASMPLHLYQGHRIAADNLCEGLVSYAPNPNFSPFTFVQTMEAIRNTEGTAYALIVPRKATYEPERFDILDPRRVQPMRDPDTKEMWYKLSMDDGAAYFIPECWMLILRYMSANGQVGVRPVDVLRGSLEYDQTVKEIALDKLDGVNQGIFLKVPNSGLDRDGKSKLIDDFLDAYEKSNHRVVVLEGGLEATPFNQSAIDAQLLDVERITRNRVATVYNIPPHMLGDYTDTSFSTAEQQMQEFLQLTIIPIVAQWEQELNRKMLTPEQYKDGYRFRFDTTALCRADLKTTSEMYQMSIRSGWMTPNEVRDRQGLPPDVNGDKLMSSRDLIPLETAVNHPELLLSGKTAGKEE